MFYSPHITYRNICGHIKKKIAQLFSIQGQSSELDKDKIFFFLYYYYYSFSEIQPLVYFIFFALSLSSQHKSILRCLSKDFLTYKRTSTELSASFASPEHTHRSLLSFCITWAHPQCSALLLHHLSTSTVLSASFASPEHIHRSLLSLSIT